MPCPFALPNQVCLLQLFLHGNIFKIFQVFQVLNQSSEVLLCLGYGVTQSLDLRRPGVSPISLGFIGTDILYDRKPAGSDVCL
jgi:hypothetical protein